MPTVLRLFAANFCVLLITGTALAKEPLHDRIDRLIDAKANGAVAESAEDAAYHRRVFLDFAGRIPTVTETKKFLADKSPEKRRKLIDQLMNSEEFPRRMSELFHVHLMERRGDHKEWRAFLREAFKKNQRWDRIAAAILNPDADDKSARGAAFFITNRLTKVGQNPTDYPGLTRDIGRLFLGMDLQCAQCHDHLHVDEYKQAMFQGLFAFVGNAFIRRDVAYPAVGVKPLAKKVDFMSVFVKEQMMIGPQVPGDKELAIPVFKKGEEFAKPPDRKKRFPGVPKFNTLKSLGERLPRADNKPFVRNIVNRLWFVMMGRGIVEPLDLHHSENPPSHPKLLDVLAADFVAHRLDVKYLLRELALTKTYQRSSRLPKLGDNIPTVSYRIFNERALSAEQLLRSMLTAMAPTNQVGRAEIEKQFAKLEKDFVFAFGNTPKTPEVTFSPSVKSALFLSNSKQVLDLIKPQPGNLTDRLAKQKSPSKVAEELYLAVLSRPPTAEEIQTVTAFLTKHKNDRPKAVGQLTWALLSSTEFCLNH